MGQYIVTSQILNKRNGIPASFADKSSIVDTVPNGTVINGDIVAVVPNPSLGKWVKGGDYYYWAGGLQEVSKSVAPALGTQQAVIAAPAIATGNWCLEALKIPAIWDILGEGNLGKGIRVAVLDTGIDDTTAQLLNIDQKLHVFTNEYDKGFKDGDNVVCRQDDNTSDSSGNYHGTGVASVIGAKALNGYYTGIAPDCSVSVFKIRDNYAFNKSKQQIPYVLNQIANADFDIVCMSFQFISEVDGLSSSLQACADNGILLFAAAGNDDNGGYAKNYPGYYGSCYCISACNSNLVGILSTAQFNERVKLIAPGGEVPVFSDNQKHSTLGQTSIATGITAGVAALLLSYIKPVLGKKDGGKKVTDILFDTGSSLVLNTPDNGSITAKIIQPYNAFLNLKATVT